MSPPRAPALPPDVFLDTSYILALVVARDAHHSAARVLSTALRRAGTRLVTTHAVMFETGNALARPPYRAIAPQALRNLEVDPRTQVLGVTEERYRQARALFDARPDQSWGLTDCVSFVVMRELGLTAALTADHHFEQAGFRALLREPWE